MELERRGQVIAVLNLGQPVMPGGALLFSGRRQPSCDGMSRMMREYHVRFCEGLGVKSPGPTRHLRKSQTVPGASAAEGEADVIGRKADIESWVVGEAVGNGDRAR